MVKSAKVRGSQFTVSCRRPASRPPDEPSAARRRRGRAGVTLVVKRLLLVEDEPGLVMTLTDRLTREGYAVETSADGESGLERAAVEAFDLDPARRDAAADERLRRAARAAPARHRDTGHRAHRARPGRRQGRRPQARRRRLRHQAVRDDGAAGAHRGQAAARAGRARSPPTATSSATSRSTSARRRSPGTAQPLELAAREFQLLRYFIEHRGATLTREELLNEVWGYNAMPSTRTVDVHVAWLRQKLEPVPQAPAVHPHRPRAGLQVRRLAAVQ